MRIVHRAEKYGGLKKFLEAHPEVFTIGPDHPFNPTVLLASSLQPQLLQYMSAKQVREWSLSGCV
jgi:hypothetical protein